MVHFVIGQFTCDDNQCGQKSNFQTEKEFEAKVLEDDEDKI